jgi:hypothetical protein
MSSTEEILEATEDAPHSQSQVEIHVILRGSDMHKVTFLGVGTSQVIDSNIQGPRSIPWIQDSEFRIPRISSKSWTLSASPSNEDISILNPEYTCFRVTISAIYTSIHPFIYLSIGYPFIDLVWFSYLLIHYCPSFYRTSVHFTERKKLTVPEGTWKFLGQNSWAKQQARGR